MVFRSFLTAALVGLFFVPASFASQAPSGDQYPPKPQIKTAPADKPGKEKQGPNQPKPDGCPAIIEYVV